MIQIYDDLNFVNGFEIQSKKIQIYQIKSYGQTRPYFRQTVVLTDTQLCLLEWDTNPHIIIIEQELNVPKVIVWGGIWSNGVVGPSFFFEGNVTSEKYLQMLTTNVIP